MIVKAQAMLLIGATKYDSPSRLGHKTTKVWHAKYVLPHSARPTALPRFGPAPQRWLYLEVNWKYGPDEDLNAQFIRALAESVAEVEVSVLLL